MDVITFTALAEPNRFNIVELLRGGPRPVGDIAKLLRLRQPQTSKHLRVLADAGIVEVRPMAQKRLYKLRPQTFAELDEWVDSYKEVMEARLDRLDKVLKESNNPSTRSTSAQGRPESIEWATELGVKKEAKRGSRK